MSETLNLFATVPLGLEGLLADELASLGAEQVRPLRAGVEFVGDLELAYRCCLWSRIANRILLPLARFRAASTDALYDAVRDVDWASHLDVEGTLAVDCSTSRSVIDHALFAAQKVKDAVVDQFRERTGTRPTVRLAQPDLRINLHIDRDEATLSIDLSGDSLHRRGYRLAGAAAPLKENLAAAILRRAGWRELAASGAALVDPMCGSATLVVEAALIAGDIAPGLGRTHFGFTGWRQHRSEVWARLVDEARQRRDAGLGRLPRIIGYDIDRDAIAAAWQNIERAGLRGRVHIERKAVADVRPSDPSGLLVVNPPYGERLGEAEELQGLYSELGDIVREHFGGWRMSLLTGNPELAFRLGIRAKRHWAVYNGRIPCRLFNFEVIPERFFVPRELESTGEPMPRTSVLLRKGAAISSLSDQAEMLANRLRKNLRHLGRWARTNGIDCYRLYDADLPEFAVSVDLYQAGELWVQVQEYQAPSTIDAAAAERRLIDALAAIRLVLEVPQDRLFLKIRQRQKGSAQYEKQAASGRFHEVMEGGCRFWVNFEDYLDTGLFLDHRLTRSMIRELAPGRNFLNLFAYTGSATVYAAKGGAASTTSVDLSNTYLDWAARNLESNGIRGERHLLVRADVLRWVDEAHTARARYDLIFLDPPTFSQSKKLDGTFDVQRDHVELLRGVGGLLSAGGVLLFSTNAQKFRLHADELSGFAIEDLRRATLPKDFERNPRIHQCWKLTPIGPSP
ncbi:MAG: bifunctional 23S rRNA (guanine(2069)-N(7))-methyltransferase RlmK/23S rRNA (guanine(2445)-N(2))-methyltransferase RlmL [Methylotetracoccus sp.]